MRVTDEAIDRIKQMIVTGELRPGDRLPREPDLAARLGLSRSSLREAVKALALIRVLEVRQGDGTFVTSLDPALLMETMGFVLDLHQDASVLEFFEVRRILEPAAAARAALRMADEDIADVAQAAGRARPGAVGGGPARQRRGVPSAARDRQRQPRARLDHRQPAPADLPGPDLARPDPERRRRPDAGRTPGDPRRDRGARAGGGQVLGDGAHRRRRTLDPGSGQSRGGRSSTKTAEGIGKVRSTC